MARPKMAIPDDLKSNFVTLNAIQVSTFVRERIREERIRRLATEGVRYTIGNIIDECVNKVLPPCASERNGAGPKIKPIQVQGASRKKPIAAS